MSPEAAVRFAASVTSARVSETPELIQPLAPLSPREAFWHLTLDRAVTVTPLTGGDAFTTQDVFVNCDPGHGAVVLLAKRQMQSAEVTFSDLPANAGGARRELHLMTAPAAPFNLVTVEPTQ